MAVGRAVIFNIIEESVGHFEDGLVGDVLVGPGRRRVSTESSPGALVQPGTHWIPNLMPLKRLGSLSTSCCLTGPSVELAMASPLQPETGSSSWRVVHVDGTRGGSRSRWVTR